MRDLKAKTLAIINSILNFEYRSITLKKSITVPPTYTYKTKTVITKNNVTKLKGVDKEINKREY